jgi:hypothetical protein
MKVIKRLATPFHRSHLRAKADPEGEQKNERFEDRWKRRGVPIAQVNANVTTKDRAALPIERWCVWVHE